MCSALSPESVQALWQAIPPLAGQTVTCIGVRLAADPDSCCRAVAPFVSELERQRAARYFHAIDAARHLLGRFVVRGVLARTLGKEWIAEELAREARGKPFLPGCGIDFSISHAGAWVWVAFCREAVVGIDVEEVRQLEDLAELVGALHPAESASIREKAEDANVAFFRCWTRKEAVLKAAGEGLLRAPDSFQVRTDAVPGDWLMEVWRGRGDEWTTLDVAVPGDPSCQVALAAHAPGLQVASVVLELPAFRN